MDIFDDAVHLNANGARKLKTSIGGILTILFVGFLTFQALVQLNGMIHYRNPALIEVNEFHDNPGTIGLNSTNNFVMAAILTVNNNQADLRVNSIVSFTSTFSQYFRKVDGTIDKFKSKIHWAPCTQDNFNTNIFDKDTFTTYNLEYAYCPTYIDFKDSVTGDCPAFVKNTYSNCTTDPNFSISGTFLSKIFEFIQFKLTLCDQTHDQYIEGLSCDTIANINNVFATSDVQFNLYFANNLVDPVNHVAPNRTFLDSEYWNLHPSVSKVVDIFFDEETVQNYDNFFFQDSYDNHTYYSVQKYQIRELEQYNGNELLTWNLRRSNINHVFSRDYVKLIDVASYIGGIGSLIMVACALIVVGYSKFKYQMRISNELYDFEPVDKRKKKKQKPAKPVVKMQSTKVVPVDSPDETDPKRSKPFLSMMGLGKLARDGEKHTVKEYFEGLKQKQRKLPFGEWKYFKYLFADFCCCCLKRSRDHQLVRKARDQVRKDLDIIKIIEKLQEIDKLKLLLLNKYQREAFNFIERPMITVDEPNPVHSKSPESLDLEAALPITSSARLKGKTKGERSTLSKYTRLYAAYKHLKDDSAPNNVKYNKKLLDMIGPELKQVFQQVDRVLGNNTDPMRFEETVDRIMNERVGDIITDRLSIDDLE